MAELAAELSRAGCVAAEEEAAELAVCAGGDRSLLRALADRRLAGEPLAWITGRADFGDQSILVHAGVYVPRWQSIELGPAGRRPSPRRRQGHRPVHRYGCGRGRPARQRDRRRASWPPTATAVPSPAPGRTESRPIRVTCSPPCRRRSAARPMSSSPWCPTSPPPSSICSPATRCGSRTPPITTAAADGADVLRRVVTDAPGFLRPGGAVLLELGGDQAEAAPSHTRAPRVRRRADLVRRGRGPARPGGDATADRAVRPLSDGRRPAPPTSGPPRASAGRGRGTARAPCGEPTRHRRRGRRRARGRGSWSGSSPP